MTKCFCGFDHSEKMSKEIKLLADAYHDLYQRVRPGDEWMRNVRKLQSRRTKRALNRAKAPRKSKRSTGSPRK